MTNWLHSWRAAVRITRRDAWRFKGRSFLVLAMIALPVFGVSAVDLTIRSSQLSPAEVLDRELGRADARFYDAGYSGEPIQQSPDGTGWMPVDEKTATEGPSDIKKALPAGATVLENTVGYAKLRTTHGLLNTEIRELKAADSLAQGIMTLDHGRFPGKTGEVAATTHFLRISGLQVGSKLTARGLDADYRIVGAYEVPDDLKADQVTALPGALLAPLDKALKASGVSGTESNTSHFVSVPGGFTWNMVQQVNTHGFAVMSRATSLNPPAAADVPLYTKHPEYRSSPAGSGMEERALIGTVVVLAMLEICLLAGAAFAVGARRSRRQLGLVGANGGDRRHIRAIVLAGGLVIGVAAAVVGTVLGLLATWSLRPVLEGYMGQRFGAFDIRPLELLGIGLVAVVTGLLAALVPAITASRQTVLASLTGRRGVRKSNKVLPALGLTAFVLGAAAALYGATVVGELTLVAGGSVLAELGVVALTPTLVGAFGRLGGLLPLSPRLALRDAVRNRGRTAPAVAAVLAAVAGTVAVSTYIASDDAKSRASYEAQLPDGAATVMVFADGGRDVPAARAAIQKNLPIDVRADVGRINVQLPGCSENRGDCGDYEVVVPQGNECPIRGSEQAGAYATKLSKAERLKIANSWRCERNNFWNGPPSGVLIGDAKVLTVLGIKDPQAEKALANGEVVSFSRQNVDKNGNVGIKLITDLKKAEEADSKGEERPGTVKPLKAYQTPAKTNAYGVSMIVPQVTADAAGIGTAPLGAYYTTASTPSDAQRQQLDSDLDKTGTYSRLYIESGYSSDNSLIQLALAIFAGLITIGAAGIATGLAQADAEADLRTLAAVGAPERVRRTLSGFQCAVVAAMGVVLGSVAGVLPAFGLLLTERKEAMDEYRAAIEAAMGEATLPHVPIVLPWGTLAALIVAVPLGAAILAALVTRSHRTLSRRAAA